MNKKRCNFDGENITNLPKPSGWRVIVGMLTVEDSTEGGIILVEETKTTKAYLNCIGKVLAIGDLCYQDSKFQGGVGLDKCTPKAWVNVGDVVLIRQYTGQDIVCVEDGKPQKLKLLNDDEILGIIPDMNSILT